MSPAGHSLSARRPEGIAIFQTAFPGDVILAGGLLRSAREAWPEVPVAVVVRPESAPLARMMGQKVEVIEWEKKRAGSNGMDATAVIDRLRAGPWDVALIPQRFPRTARLARRAGIPIRVGFDLAMGARLLYSHQVPYRRGVHEIERNHDLLVAAAFRLDTPVPPLRLPLFILPPEGIAQAEGVFERLGNRDAPPPFATVAPGSVWATKRWPSAEWSQLVRLLAEGGLPVVLLGGPDDRALCEQIAEEAGSGEVAAGMVGWEGSAALLSRAHLLVSGDSAPTHLAGAVRCPAVTLFGPTVPGFGFGPTGKGSRSVGLPLGCRPCTLHGGDACPEGHFRCMLDLTPGMVAEVVADAIEAVYPPVGRSGSGTLPIRITTPSG